MPAKSRFEGRIIFHNLRSEELGALLWALTLGGNSNLRHGLGMGKPFGFGQAHFELDEAKSTVEPNDPTAQCLSFDRYQDVFAAHMEQVLKTQNSSIPRTVMS